MNLSLDSVSSVILSHGHYDHTGGLPSFLEQFHQPVKIYVHPKAFAAKYRTAPEMLKKRKEAYIGAPPLIDLPDTAEVVNVTAPHITTDNFIVTGQIPRTPEHSQHLTGYILSEEDSPIVDPLEDSQSLILPTADGLVIITGCAHAGLANIIEYGKTITGIDKVKALIGGFHLLNASDYELKEVIEYLKLQNIQILGPCHCTGKRGQVDLLRAFPGKVSTLSTGDRITIVPKDQSTATAENELAVLTGTESTDCHPVVILFHGSKSQTAIDNAKRLVEELKQTLPERCIKIAFLSLASPSLEETMLKVTAMKPTTLSIVPAFMFNGTHLQRDLKATVDLAGETLGQCKIIITSPLGEGSELVSLLAKRLSQAEA